MRIAHKKTVDTQVVGECQAHLDKQRAIAAAAAKERRELRKATGAKAGEGCVAAWGRDAVLNAVMQYGPEVMSDKGYWDDMKRLYPESCADDRVPGTDSINGHRNKFGRVSKRFVGGRWYVWKGGKWVADAIQRKRGEVMKSEIELKPCPFCGRMATMIHCRLGESSPWRWYVTCSHQQKCGIRVMTWDYDTEAEAAAAWNRRAQA